MNADPQRASPNSPNTPHPGGPRRVLGDLGEHSPGVQSAAPKPGPAALTLAEALLERLQGAGATVTLEGDSLRVRARGGRLAPAEAQALRELKPALLEVIRERARAFEGLRAIHRAWGFDEAACDRIEAALRSGLVREVVVMLPAASLRAPGNSPASESARPAATPAPLSRG